MAKQDLLSNAYLKYPNQKACHPRVFLADTGYHNGIRLQMKAEEPETPPLTVSFFYFIVHKNTHLHFLVKFRPGPVGGINPGSAQKIDRLCMP